MIVASRDSIDIFIYFSKVFNKDVVDCNNVKIGSLRDIMIKVNEEVYPRASHLIVRRGVLNKKFTQIAWEDVEKIDGSIHLKLDKSKIVYQKNRFKSDFSLCVDILDQQVVDTDHQKVVRVNDVHLLKVNNQLYLAHVDVGIRGLVRRLAWTRCIDSIVRTFSPNSFYLTREDLISWKNTQALTLGRTKNVLRLGVAKHKLSQIPPAELAEIMEDLDIFEKRSLFRSLDVTIQRKVFADLSTHEQEELIDQLDDAEAVDLLENIPTDEAVDLLLKLPKVTTLQLMKRMETKTSKKLRKLLGFSKNSAGGLMTTEYLSLHHNALVKDAIQKIKDNVNYSGNIYHVYIVDEQNRFIDSTSLRRFINVSPETPILDTCYHRKIFVHVDDGVEEIALLLEKYKFSSVAVVSKDDVLQGVITIDDVMEQLISIAWTKYKEKL